MAPNPAFIVALGWLGLLTSGAASSEEPEMPDGGQPAVTIATVTDTEVTPLWLPRTRADWDSIVANIDLAVQTTNGIEEVMVTAPADLLPMKLNAYDDMWGGILAPVWAVLHPTQAWRVLLPVPPK